MAEKDENTAGNDSAENTYKEPSKSVIEGWKKKYPGKKIFRLEVIHPDDKTKHATYLRQADMIDMQRAKASENKKAFTFNQSIFENCVLECDPVIKADDSLYMGVLGQIDEVVRIAEASIKEV